MAVFGARVPSPTMGKRVTMPVARDQATSSAVPTTQISTSTKALAAFLAFLCVVIILIITWRIRVWLNRREARRSPSGFGLEKAIYEKQTGFDGFGFHVSAGAGITRPQQPVLAPIIPANPDVRWQPQIRSVGSSSIPSWSVGHSQSTSDSASEITMVTPPPAAKVFNSHKSSTSLASLPEGIPSKHPYACASNKPILGSSPPPNYHRMLPASTTGEGSLKHKKSGSKNSLNRNPSTTSSAPLTVTVPPTSFNVPAIPGPHPTPRTAASLGASPNPSGTDLPATIVTDTPTRYSHRKGASNPSLTDILSSPTKPAESQLPRLMIVSSTFKPARDDEILVKTGETLRMLEEYEDGWCAVQRVGKKDEEKGVMPRFCLSERPKVLTPPKLIHTFSLNGARQ